MLKDKKLCPYDTYLTFYSCNEDQMQIFKNCAEKARKSVGDDLTALSNKLVPENENVPIGALTYIEKYIDESDNFGFDRTKPEDITFYNFEIAADCDNPTHYVNMWKQFLKKRKLNKIKMFILSCDYDNRDLINTDLDGWIYAERYYLEVKNIPTEEDIECMLYEADEVLHYFNVDFDTNFKFESVEQTKAELAAYIKSYNIKNNTSIEVFFDKVKEMI